MASNLSNLQKHIIRDLQQKIAKHPNVPENYWLLGDLYNNSDMHQEAIQIYHQLMDLLTAVFKVGTKNPKFYNYAGLCEDQLCLPHLAHKYYLKAIQLKPNNYVYHYNLAMNEDTMGTYKAGINEMETAIQLNPDSSDSYDQLASINENAKHYDQAIEDEKIALLLNRKESKDSQTTYYYNLARIENEAGRYTDADNDMHNALATYPRDADIPKRYSDGLKTIQDNVNSQQQNNDDNNNSEEQQTYDKDYDHEDNDLPYDPDVNYSKQLDKLIGLQSVKSMIKTYVHQVEMNEIRTGSKIHPRMHLVFEGDPGTGKTTVAKLFCRILYQKHIITKKRFISVNATQLVNSRYGMSAKQVRSFVQQSIGGVLFIDEAYYLAHRSDGNSVCQDEAMDAFLSAIDQHQHDLVVIMAGYTHKMENLLNRSNPGLQSRFANEDRIVFPDYSSDECIQILNYFMHQSGYHIKDDRAKALLIKYMHKFIMTKRNDSQNTFANARTVENIFNRMTHNLANRLFTWYSVDQLKNLPKEKRSLLNDFNCDDIKRTFECFSLSSNHQAANELHNLIGLDNVKTMINHYVNFVRIARLRHGNVNPNGMDLVFEGNPGTGKTTVAKIFCKLLYQKGLVKSNNYQVLSASALESSVVGQSAANLRQAFYKAKGGVLFIDEAYALMNTKKKGNNLIPELVDDLTEYKNNVVVIMAGYPKAMEHLLKHGNEGLSSRFQYRVPFKDYTHHECWKILNYDMKKDQLKFASTYAKNKLKRGFNDFIKRAKASDQYKFANARTVNIFFKRLQGSFANRLCTSDSSTWLETLKLLGDKKLNTITIDDVKNTLKQCQHMYQDDDQHRIGF